MPHHLPAATTAAPTTAVALSRSAHPHAYALILLASATALTISGTAAFTLYATPIPFHISALAADTARVVPVWGAAAWLLHLMMREAVDQPGHRPTPAGARGCSVLIAAAALVLNSVTDPGTGAWAWRNLAVAALFVALTLAVAREHGISPARLGICPPGARTLHGRAQALAVGAGTALAGSLSGWLFQHLPTFLPAGGGAGSSQAEFLGWTSYGVKFANVLYTGVVEDLVMVGALVALLGAARRPVWQMYALSISIEIGMHLYLGAPAVGIIPVAAASLALYRHTGRLTAIVLGHIAYDLLTDLPLTGWALGALLGATALVAGLVASACAPVRSAADRESRDSR